MKTTEQRLFNKKKQVTLLKQIRVLMASGLQLQQVAVSIEKYGGKTEKKIAQAMLKAMNSGRKTTTGLKPWIDPLAFASLTTAEKTGQWLKGLDNALIQLTASGASSTLLIKETWKPLAGIIVMLAVAAGARSFIFPMLAEILPPERWGAPTWVAYRLGDFILQWGGLLALLTSTLVIAVGFSLPWLTGPVRQFVDRWPVYKQYRIMQAGSLLRSTGNLVAGGIEINDALRHCQPQLSRYMQSHVKAMLNNINHGCANIGDIFDTGLLNPAELHALKITGNIGRHDEILLNSAEIHYEATLREFGLIIAILPAVFRMSALLIGVILFAGILSLVTGVISSIRF